MATDNDEFLNRVRDYIEQDPWCHAEDLARRSGLNLQRVEEAIKRLVRRGEVRRISPAYKTTEKLVRPIRGKKKAKVA